MAMEIGNQMINHLKFKAWRDKRFGSSQAPAFISTVEFGRDGFAGADTGSPYCKILPPRA